MVYNSDKVYYWSEKVIVYRHSELKLPVLQPLDGAALSDVRRAATMCGMEFINTDVEPEKAGYYLLKEGT